MRNKKIKNKQGKDSVNLVFFNNLGELLNYKPVINKSEHALLLDAINNHNGEIIEPANDDNKTMEVIVSLYNKKLVRIDFKKDKLFVSELGLAAVKWWKNIKIRWE